MNQKINFILQFLIIRHANPWHYIFSVTTIKFHTKLEINNLMKDFKSLTENDNESNIYKQTALLKHKN